MGDERTCYVILKWTKTNANEGRSGAGRISASLSGFCGFPLSSILMYLKLSHDLFFHILFNLLFINYYVNCRF